MVAVGGVGQSKAGDLETRVGALLNLPATEVVVMPYFEAGMSTIYPDATRSRHWYIYPVCLRSSCNQGADDFTVVALMEKERGKLYTGQKSGSSYNTWCREESGGRVCNNATAKTATWKKSSFRDFGVRSNFAVYAVSRANRLANSADTVRRCYRRVQHDYSYDEQNTCPETLVTDIECNVALFGYTGPLTVAPGSALYRIPNNATCQLYILTENPVP